MSAREPSRSNKERRLGRRSVLLGLPLAAAAAAWTPRTLAGEPGVEEVAARRPRKTGKRSDHFPNIALRTQYGDEVRFYDDLVKDRIVIINLMYTTCEGICTPVTSNLTRLHKHLGKRIGRDILMLSLSIDPEVDTPERLREYARLFGDKPGWLYLTGDYDEIDDLRRKLGVYDLDPVIDADRSQHSGIVTFGNDTANRWAALPAQMDSAGLARDITRLTRGKTGHNPIRFRTQPDPAESRAEKPPTHHHHPGGGSAG